MISAKRVKLACFFLAGLILTPCSFASPSSKIERAKACFEAYVEALQKGAEKKAKKFWNREESEKYRVYDWQWECLIFRGVDLRHLNYRILKGEEKEDHVMLEVEWYYREGKAGPLQRDVRYFIEEDGKMVGANPIFIHTRGWLQRVSRHFIYHYKEKEKEKPDSSLLHRMDRFYERMVEFLRVDYQKRIDYYKCDFPEEVGELFGMEASLARSQMSNSVVASVQRFAPHEIVHIISYRILPPNQMKLPPVYLNEGLAYYLGGASYFAPELLLSWAKNKLEADGSIKLKKLIKDPLSYGTNEGAGLFCSFVKFLIDTEGLLKFKQLFSAGESFDEQREALTRIYGRSLPQLEREWKNFVLTLSLPEIEIVNGIRGKELFSVADPSGDDKGDGDYVYPENENALSGIFDLLSFKVCWDDELVYFYLQFANLICSENLSEKGFNGTFAAIAIDSDDREKSGNTQLFGGNGNLEFSNRDGYEFVIEVSNAGILVYDKHWVWHLLFLEALSFQTHIRGNEISFALPRQVIASFDSVNANPANWKFQVLTGGQVDGWRNTADGVGRFMEVGKRAQPDKGGGGTDTDLNPNVYDILTPKGISQERILGGYDVAQKRKAIIPMINLRQM